MKKEQLDKIKQLLTPYSDPSIRLVRIGGNRDGGYIFAEDFFAKSDTVYSYGVGPNASWITFDLHAAAMGKSVYLYDGTIDFWDSRKEFIFKKENVNSENFHNHILGNGHAAKTDMVLKMDIEGHEYELFLNSDEKIFGYFNQIGIEIHDVINSYLHVPLGEIPFLIRDSDARAELKIQTLEKLNKHYYLMHLHANNCGIIVDGMPDILELTYIRKDLFKNEPNISSIARPIAGLDFPNDPNKRDVVLDWWNK